jgi:hypothetical protein
MLTLGEYEDRYTLMLVLRRAGSARYRKIVEPFLNDAGDPQLSALALTTLCTVWTLAGDYRGILLTLLGRVDWDVEEYVRLQASSDVGEYLWSNSDAELLQAICNIFSYNRERGLIRSVAYCSLYRSEKLEWNEIPSAGRVIYFYN